MAEIGACGSASMAGIMKPWLPLTGEVNMPGEDDRRAALAEWLHKKDNPLFAHAGVNRIWGYLIGRGIVEPVDDFRASNPPSNEELLNALVKDFIDSGFDQKKLIPESAIIVEAGAGKEDRLTHGSYVALRVRGSALSCGLSACSGHG